MPAHAVSHRRPNGHQSARTAVAVPNKKEEPAGHEHLSGTVAADNHVSNVPLNTESEIREIKENLELLESQLAEINDTWRSRAGAVEEELESTLKSLAEKEHELEKIHDAMHAHHHQAEDKTYLGPSSLIFVDGTVFMLIATLIIVTNIALMLLQMVDHDYAEEFFWPNQFFMAFYIVELILKALLFQRDLLCGPFELVWWNWLDLVIVLGGVMDMYVKPALSAMGLIKSGNSQMSSILSFLRILRLARIMKVIKVFLMADFAWTETDKFQAFIMGVIGFNCILMGLEADFADFFLWPYLEQLLLTIFFFELAVRLKREGLAFFYQGDVVWNWLDGIIVGGGVLDGWAMPTYEFIKLLLGMPPSSKGSLGQVMTMLRMVRILRMLRLVRLVKNVKPLFDLMTGMIASMQGMAWVLLLTVIVLYIVSLICVKLLGHGLAFPDGAPPAARATFPDIGTAMFICFMAMNGDVGHLEDIMAAVPCFRYLVMLFMVISSWAILSILTAVVSDKMIQTGEATEEDDEAEENRIKQEVTCARLEKIFEEMDNHHRGFITRGEFDCLLENKFRSQEFAEIAHMDKKDLKQLFDYLSEIPAGETDPILKHDTFFDGLRSESRAVNERSMMRLEKRINSMHQEFFRHNKLIVEKLDQLEKRRRDAQ